MSNRKTSKKQISIEFIVGFVFLIALALLGVFTIILGSESSGVAIVEVDFKDIDKVQIGDKVLFRGFEIGSVKSMKPTDDKQHIRVALQLTAEQQFYEGYVVEIRSSSILGGTYIYMESGDPKNEKLANNAILEGSAKTDVLTTAVNVLNKIGEAADDVKTFTASLNNKDSTIGRMVNNDDLYKDMQKTLKSIKDAGNKISTAADDVKDLKAEASKALVGIQDAGKQVSEAGKSVKKSSDKLNMVLTNVEQGKGTFGKLLTEDKLYDDLVLAVNDIKKISAKLNDEESSLYLIMNDKGEFYKSLTDVSSNLATAMKEVNEIAAKINTGDGTIAKLINKDDLYKDAKRTLKDIQSAINDIREAAPISSLGSFIFGAF